MNQPGPRGSGPVMRAPRVALVLGLAAVGCSSAGKPPAVASSTGQTSYAIGYADELASANKAVETAQAKEKQLSAGFAAHVDELKKTDWDKVETVMLVGHNPDLHYLAKQLSGSGAAGDLKSLEAKFPIRGTRIPVEPQVAEAQG